MGAWIGHEKYMGSSCVFGMIGMLFAAACFLLGSETLGYISIFFFMLSGIVNTNRW